MCSPLSLTGTSTPFSFAVISHRLTTAVPERPPTPAFPTEQHADEMMAPCERRYWETATPPAILVELGTELETATPPAILVELGMDHDTGIVRLKSLQPSISLKKLLLGRKNHFPSKLAFRKAIKRERVWVNGAVQRSKDATVCCGDEVSYKVNSYVIEPDADQVDEEGSLVADFEHEALSKLLARRSGLTDTVINRNIKGRNVLVDGEPAGSRAQRVCCGQSVSWVIKRPPVLAYVCSLDVPFENEHMAIVVKPAGMLMDASGETYSGRDALREA